MAELIKGADVAGAIFNEMKTLIEENDLHPTLAVIRVGENPSDLAYERGVEKTCQRAGIEMKVYAFDQDISQEALEGEFARINSDPDIDGILLFKPLPSHLDEKAFDRMIDPEKDMDCISPANQIRIYTGEEGYYPCTAEAVIRILEYAGTKISGANAVIIGRSKVIGKPLGLMLLAQNASVTWCHSKTRDIKERCRNADILVSACGVAGLIGEEIAKECAPGCIAIDVGMNYKDGKMCGDFVFDEVEGHVARITPVPGGVGSVTNTVMASHVVRSALKAKK